MRLAIETGASLVPVFSFNEVELFNQVVHEPGSRTRRLQEFLLKHTSVTFVTFSGRGPFGSFPLKTEITTVVGEPIEVVRNPSPSAEEVNELHRKFVEALESLFEDNKCKYIKNGEKIKLEIE